MKDNLKRQAYKILWIATSINFLAGLLYIWSVIKNGLKSEYGWTDTQATLPYTVAIISFVIAMTIVGRLQDQKGPRLTGTLSGLCMGLGLILSGLTKNPGMMVLTFGVITGAGIGISNVSTTPPAVKWFPPQQKGMVTGIVVAGVGIASVFYSPFTNFLIISTGIANTFLFLGVGVLVLTVTLAQFLKNPPAGFKPAIAAKAPETAQRFSADINWRGMLKLPDFYKIWIMMAFSSAAGLMIIGQATTITQYQAKKDIGFLLVILLAVFNAGGRILGGAVSDKIERITLMRIIFIVLGLNMLLFSFYNSIALVAFGFAVTGLCYGAIFSVFPTTVLDRYGVRYFGSNYGLIMTAWGFGGIIGPMTAAIVFDAVGNYQAAYYVACALLVVATLITLTFRRPAAAVTKTI